MKQNTPPLVLRSEMRTDSVPVDEHYSTEGYFYDNPILTRTGIFVYHLEDGSERRELRRPEDVFDPKSLASYEGKPIIITHDAQVIDKDNAHRERVGTILTPGQQDGETVRAKIVIDDPDAVKASGLRELSVGYYQDLIMEPGEWNGEPYDAIQTNAFAPSTHEHSASQITSGNLPIERGGTGSGTSADACKNLGAMRNVGGTFTGTVYFANGTVHYVTSAGDAHFKSLSVSGDISAQRVYDAVYNDYAELMPRGEQTEPGDIIALDTGSQMERYIKATNLSSRIAGIHTDEYAMLIGGNKVVEGQDFLEENLPDFIPVSLAGRVHTKVVGPVHTGDYIVLSSAPGVGRAVGSCESYPANKIVGYACEGDNRTDLRLVKVRVGGV